MRRKGSHDDIDDVMADVNAREERERRRAAAESGTASMGANRTEVGVVEKYYNKLEVVAISLSAELRVGDLIEIGSDEEHVRQRIASMQINRVDVESASPGDSVGIKMKYPVDEGASVYKLQ